MLMSSIFFLGKKTWFGIAKPYVILSVAWNDNNQNLGKQWIPSSATLHVELRKNLT
jgi:hypothetical protein